MAVSKIQSEIIRHNKVDQYAHSLIREIAFIDMEIGTLRNDGWVDDMILEHIEERRENMFYALEYLAFYLGYKVEKREEKERL